MPRTLLALAFALVAAAPAAAQYGKAPVPGDNGPPAPENVRFDQNLGAYVPLDGEFYDHLGQPVRLRDAVGGKPTVLVLAYFRCPKLCNEVLHDTCRALREAAQADKGFTAGGPFNAVVVSIDPMEPPALARQTRQSFLAEYDGRAEDAPGITFLTASHGQGTDVTDADRKIKAVADAVGFKYTSRRRGRQVDFEHASGITILAGDGRVSSYILGLNYDPGELKAALAKARNGEVGSLSDRVSQFCFVYDEVRGHYRPTMRALALVSVPFVFLVGFLTYRTVRRGLRDKPIVVPPAPPGPPQGGSGLPAGPSLN